MKQNNNNFDCIILSHVLDGVFRKLQTPAAPHPGQALLGAAEIINFENFIEKVKDGYNIIITSTISFQKIFEKLSKINKKINIITDNLEKFIKFL